MPVHDWAKVFAGTFHDFQQTRIIALRAFDSEDLPKTLQSAREAFPE